MSMRPKSALLSISLFWSVLVGQDSSDVWRYILGMLLIIIAYGVVTLLNDIADYAIDKANGSWTPLSRGVVAKEQLYSASLGLSIIGSIAAAFISPAALVWFSLYLWLGWLYSGPLNFKGRGYAAEVILGICYGVMPFALGLIATDFFVRANIVFLLTGLFAFAAGISLIKDFRDMKGDRKYGKRTPLVLYGERVVRWSILALTTLGYVSVCWSVISSGAHDNFVTLGAAALVIVNFVLLAPKKTMRTGTLRYKRGGISRLLFFAWVAVLNSTIIF